MEFQLVPRLLNTLDANALVSFCVGLISLCALFLTIFEARATRKHNRLSLATRLTPGLVFDKDNPAFYSNVENTGIGPAIIKTYEVTIADRKFTNEHIDWVVALDSLGLPGEVNGMNFSIGEFIQPGKVYPLLSFASVDPEFDCKMMLNAIKKIEIQLKYESVYGDEGLMRLNFHHL